VVGEFDDQPPEWDRVAGPVGVDVEQHVRPIVAPDEQERSLEREEIASATCPSINPASLNPARGSLTPLGRSRWSSLRSSRSAAAAR